MKKQVEVAIRGLGADFREPRAPELAEWVRSQRGKTCDILSYYIEQTLKPQTEVDTPAAGGTWYGERWKESIGGIENGLLTAEPHGDAAAVTADAGRMQAVRKGAWASAPPPSALYIGDAYYDDADECSAALAGCYRQLMRAMRDEGVRGHVFIADAFDDVELEVLAGGKTLFCSFSRDPGVHMAILEHQTTLAVPSRDAAMAISLGNEYEIRRIILVDADSHGLALCADNFDPDEIIAGGYCRSACDAYWKSVKASARIVLDS
ncbi:MAG: hypothetical protein GKC04_06020 [Methanomicrobiales archaeon]|nr:hypothetical protein [Methanomicrobiales archaeon]